MFFSHPLFVRIALGFLLLGVALGPSQGAGSGAAVPSGEALLRTLSNPKEEKAFENILGNPQAPVVIVAYGSLSCGVCAEFHHGPLERMLKKYEKSGKVCFVLKDYPTDGPSIQASLLAWCFPEKSGALRKSFYLSQGQWVYVKDPVAALKEIAQKHGISPEACKACLESKALLHDIVGVHEKEKKLTHLTHVPLIFFVHRQKKEDGRVVMEVKDVSDGRFQELDRLTRLALGASKNQTVAPRSITD